MIHKAHTAIKKDNVSTLKDVLKQIPPEGLFLVKGLEVEDSKVPVP